MVQKSHKSTRVTPRRKPLTITVIPGEKYCCLCFGRRPWPTPRRCSVATTAARAQQKVSKELAQYQDSPKDDHKCSECSFFEPT